MMSESDFSGKVKGQTERGREMIERTGTSRGTQNTSRNLQGLRKWHTNTITEGTITCVYNMIYYKCKFKNVHATQSSKRLYYVQCNLRDPSFHFFIFSLSLIFEHVSPAGSRNKI